MARKIRIECEQRTRAGGVLKCLLTGVQPMFYRGEAITLELALFANGRMIQRADLTYLKVRWKSGATLLSETVVASSSLSSALTAQQWRQGNGALASVNYTDSATGVLPAGMLTFEVTGTLTVGGESVFASGTVEAVTLAGLLTGTSPTPGPPTSYSKEESAALYAPIGSTAGLSASIAALETFTARAGASGDGRFLRAIAQSLLPAEKTTVRANIGALIAGGLQELTGSLAGFDLDTGLNSSTIETTPLGTAGALTRMSVDGNTEIYLRAPALPVGVPHTLEVEQGIKVYWDAAYSFPDFELAATVSNGDFVKKSCFSYMAEASGFERLTLLSDGTGKTYVRRYRTAARPQSVVDFDFRQPFVGAGLSYIKDRDTQTATAGYSGTGGTASTLTGGAPAISYAGTGSFHFAAPPVTYSRGFAVAIVYEATAGVADRVLFSIPAWGVECTMQVSPSSQIRFKPIGSAGTAGVCVANTFAAPVAAILVVRANGAGAFAVSTSDASTQVAAFSPATASGALGYWGGQAATNYLTCKIARFRLFQEALTPDQARAELDALTATYKIG